VRLLQRRTLLVRPSQTITHSWGCVRGRSNATADGVNVHYLCTSGGVHVAAASFSRPAGLSWPAGWSWSVGLSWSPGLSWSAGWYYSAGWSWYAGWSWPAGWSWTAGLSRPATGVSADASPRAAGLDVGTGGGCAMAAGGRHSAGTC